MEFKFNKEIREAFKTLKDKLAKALILALFDPEKEAVLETDASDRAIGACLT